MNTTLSFLDSLNACQVQRDAFALAFPAGLLVTGEPDGEAIARIVEAQLDVDWLCRQALTDAAWAEYLRAVAPAWAEYWRVEAAEYRRVEAAEYRRVEASALAEYWRVEASARVECQRTRAIVAWRLLADPANIKPEYRL